MGGLHGLLSVLQLSDSAFPSGRYTLSHGLETLVETGRIATGDRAGVGGLLADGLRFGIGPSDGVALACAHRSVAPDGTVDLAPVLRADRRLTSVKLAREPREASTRTGRALLRIGIGALGTTALLDYASHVEDGRAPGNHAVVFGLLGAVLDVPRPDAVAGELYAYAAGWVGAAVRLAVLDHRDAQAVLHGARDVVAEASAAAARGDVDDIHSCTPLLDLMAMRHEQAGLRLFAS